MRKSALISSICMVILLAGCATTDSNSIEAKRNAVQQMRSDVLNELYRQKPDVRAQIGNSPGYAVFSNANINLILASFGGGYGVAHDSLNNRDIYMRMGEVGIGLGMGIKDFRAVMVFHTKGAFRQFVETGWAFGAQADAAAKAADKGAATGGEATLDNITIYQITESGLALQATIKGTKFWKDAELN